MTENEIATQVVDAAFKIHTQLGPGLLESVYAALLAEELRLRGLSFTAQQAIPVIYGNIKLEIGFRADLIVDGKVIVEIKSLEASAPVHRKRTLDLSSSGGQEAGFVNQLQLRTY